LFASAIDLFVVQLVHAVAKRVSAREAFQASRFSHQTTCL
jgi:hypothetical protein